MLRSDIRAELARLLSRAPEGRTGLPRFLAAAYKFKEIGDHGVSRAISDSEAAAMIDGATSFIADIETMTRD